MGYSFVTNRTMAKKKPTKKKVAKEPTLLQRKALKATLENGGNVSKAMKDAGYSEAMAKNPQKLKESDGWKELMKSVGLDDKSLLKKSKEHLQAKQLRTMMVDPEVTDSEVIEVLEACGCSFLKSVIVEVTYTTKKGEEKTFEKKNVFYSIPDTLAQDRALDKLYKIRGAYTPEREGGVVAVQINNLLGSKKDEYGI